MSVPRRWVLMSAAALCVLAGTPLLCSATALAGEGLGVTATFGSSSSTTPDPEPLSKPDGVAANQSSGDVYVVDRGNNRVEYFSSSGGYEGSFNGSGNPGFPEGFSSPTAIAVDNACFYQKLGDPECQTKYPSNGDVYVVDTEHGVIDKLSATGSWISQLSGFSGGLLAVAVDSSGNLWVYSAPGGQGQLNEFDETGAPVTEFKTNRGAAPVLAVDSADNLYLTLGCECMGKYNLAGTQQATTETEPIRPISGLAVDLATNDLYVGQGSSLVQYGPFGEPFGAPIYRSGSHAVVAGAGIAVNSTSHEIYLADSGSNDVAILGLISGSTPPAPKTDPVSEVRSGRAVLNGDLNPGGETGGVGFYFSYASGENCTGPESATTPFDNSGANATGNSDVPASAQITGLSASTQYAFCFVAENTFGPTYGPVVKFTTASTLAAFAPTVDSEGVSGVTPFNASLEARITANNQATEYKFEYATSESEVLLGHGTPVEQGLLLGGLEEQTAPPPASPPANIGGGLTPATTYYYRVVATNASGAADGTVEQFTTLPAETPQLEEQPASQEPLTVATQQPTISLTGQVNPDFQAISSCEFQYVTEAIFNATAFNGSPGSVLCTRATPELEPGEGLGEGDSPVGVKASLTGLEANTTYYYRLLATNATGSGEGAPQHFLTLPNPPGVLTGEASEVSAYSAMITGSVNPGSVGVNSDTTYYFQYSTQTRSYNTQIPLTAADVGQGTSPVQEQASLSGLEPDTTYYYRIVASNDHENQVTYGQGKTFKTTATPPVLGAPEASTIGQSTATISTTLNTQGLPAHWELRAAITQGSLNFRAAGNSRSSTAEALTLSLGSLTPGAVYYYKLIAENPDGTVETAEGSFTTLPAPPLASSSLFPTTPLLALPTITAPVEEATSPPAKKAKVKKHKAKGGKGKKKRKSKRGKGKSKK